MFPCKQTSFWQRLYWPKLSQDLSGSSATWNHLTMLLLRPVRRCICLMGPWVEDGRRLSTFTLQKNTWETQPLAFATAAVSEHPGTRLLDILLALKDLMNSDTKHGLPYPNHP